MSTRLLVVLLGKMDEVVRSFLQDLAVVLQQLNKSSRRVFHDFPLAKLTTS